MTQVKRSSTVARCVRGVMSVVLGVVTQAAWASTSINHSFTGNVINQGDQSLYTITITNDALVPLTNARVTALLDNTLASPDVSGGLVTLVSGTPVSNSCGFTVDAAAPGSSVLALSNGTIPAGTSTAAAQCTFSLYVTGVTPGTYHAAMPANQTPSASHAGYEALEGAVTVTNATSADVTLQINALSAPTGTKSFSPTTGIAGDPITLTVTLTNPNATATMPLTTFTDTLPDNGGGHAMVVANPASPTVSCTGTGAVNGVVSATAGDGSWTLTGGTIGQGGACTVTVRVTVPTVNGTVQSFDNMLAAAAIGNTRGLTSPSFHQAINVQTPIVVSKSFSPTSISAGQASLMTLTITNNSTSQALPITSFVDDLTGTTIKVLTTTSAPVAAAANPTVVCDGAGAIGGTPTYTADTLDTQLSVSGVQAGPKSGALGKCVITAYVTSAVDGAHANTIAANAVVNPAGHASAAASATLTAFAQLTVTKTVAPANVAPGQWTTFTVAISNWSGGTVTNVNFRDLLPAPSGHQMTVFDAGAGVYSTDAGCSGGTWTGTDATGTSTGAAPVSGVDAGLMWTGGTVVAGSGASAGVCTITFRAQVPATAPNAVTFNNQIPIGGVTGDGPNGAITNPAASTVASVTSVNAVSVLKAFSPTSIAQGAQATLTLTLRNRVAGALTAVDLTDNLPSGMVLAANPTPTNTCGGSLQAFPNDNKLILTGGSIAARPAATEYTQCQITVRVTSTALGVLTNTIQPADFSSSGGTIAAAVSANLTVTTGVTASKSFAPTSVMGGGVARVTVTINNTYNGQLTGVSATDPLPANMTVANPANASTTCSGGSVTANPGDSSVQLVGGSLAAATSCQFAFDVLAGGASGNWVNTIPIGNITSAQGPSNTAAASATLTRQGGAVSINKSFSPVAVVGGQPSTLTLTITNPSSSAMHNVSFSDVFPTGIQVYSVPAVTSTCTGGTVTAVPGDGKITLTGATIAGGGTTCTITLQVTSVKFLNLTNSIAAGALTTAEGYTNATQVTATLSTLQGLGLMKSFSPAYVAANATSTLKMWLVSTYDPTAPVPMVLTGASYTDNLPAGVVVAATPNATTTCAGPGGAGNATVTALPGGSSVTISQAHIPPGTMCEIDVDVLAPASLGTYTNTIPANAITTDQGPTNSNAAVANLYVVNQPTIAKAFATDPIARGATSVLTVTINNGAGVALTGVSLTDVLPDGLAIAATPAATTSCAGGSVTALPGTDVLAIAGATVPAGGSCTFSAAVVGNTSGSFFNNIGAGALTSNEGLTNPGPASDSLDVRYPPTVAKSFSPVSIVAGGTASLTITLGNTNASGLTLSAALVDALPGNVVVAATPNVVKTCPGAVTAAAGATTVTYASGASIPAGGCTITVDVTSAVEGLHTNLIAAGQLQTNGGVNADPAYADLAVGPGALVPPTLAKQFSPATILVSDLSTLTLTLGNPNATDLTLAADLTDTLPGSVVVAAGALGGTCPGTVTATAGTNVVTYASGSALPAGGCTITVPVTSASAGSFLNALAAGALQTNAGSNAQAAQATLVVQALQPPTITKAFSPNTINPGGIAQLTITLDNDNASAITLTSDLIDTLPAGVTIATLPNVSTTCPNGWSVGAASLSYLTGAVVPSGGCRVQVDVTAPSNVGSPFVNVIAAGAFSTNAGSNGASAQASLFVNPPQPPSLTKAFSVARIGVGQTATLTLSLGNGNATATTLTADLVDTLPANLIIATPANVQTSAGCTPANVQATAGGGTLTYLSGGVIPANSGCSISVDVTSSVAGSYTNSIAAGALQTSVGNTAVGTSATLQVAARPTVTKAFAPATIPVNTNATLTITVGNSNAYALTTTAVMTDTFPAGLVVATPLTVGGSCGTGNISATAGGTSVALNAGTSIPAAGCTITVAVTAATGGTYTNTIAADALQTAIGNNAAPATATLTALEPPTIAKAFAPAAVPVNSDATLTLTLGNPNPSAITLTAALTDTMPANLVLGSPATVGGTCPSASVTATAGGSFVRYASGASIPSGGCTITVPVRSATPGTYTNLIAAGDLVTTAASPTSGTSADLLVSIPPTVSKAFSPATINPGDVSRLTLTLANPNVATLTLTADLTDTLPANVTVASTPNVSKTCPGTVTTTANSITYASGGTVANGACTIAVDVTSVTNAGSPYTNTIAAGALQTTAGLNAAAATAQLTVNPLQIVSVGKSFAPATMGVGGRSTLTISLRNNNVNPTTLTADFIDTFPANVVIASPNQLTVTGGCDPSYVTATAGAGTLTYRSGAPLPAMANLAVPSCTIAVDVTSAVAGSYTNTVPAGALQTVFGNSVSPASDTLLVGLLPGVSKAFAPTALGIGMTSTLTLTLANPNAYAITLTQPMVDTLPTGMTLAAAVTVGGTCTSSSVVAPANGTTVSYPAGASVPAGGCTIEVPVVAASAGHYVNTIAVAGLQTSSGANPSAAQAALDVLIAPGIAKSFAPNLVAMGMATRLTLSLQNPNALPLTLTADLVDALPTGVRLRSVPQVQTTCDPTQVVALPEGTTLSYRAGAVIPPGGCTIEVQAEATQNGTFVNVIAAGGLATNGGSNGAPASAQLTVRPLDIPLLAPWALAWLGLLLMVVGRYALGHTATKRD